MNWTLDLFIADLIKNAESNWCQEQVKMLRALLKSTCQCTEYRDAYQELESEEVGANMDKLEED